MAREGNLNPVGFQQITSLGTAVGLTVPSNKMAKAAVIQATDQNVRWRDDGTDPTASVGMQLAAGADFFYTGQLASIKFIQEAASAKLNVSYYA
jgi:hypothetical protein